MEKHATLLHYYRRLAIRNWVRAAFPLLRRLHAPLSVGHHSLSSGFRCGICNIVSHYNGIFGCHGER